MNRAYPSLADDTSSSPPADAAGARERHRRGRARVRTAVGITALVLGAALVTAPAATAGHLGGGQATGGAAPDAGRQSPAAFPPKTNSAWVYDATELGQWVDAIKAYNRSALPGRELNEVYSYGTDLEMYCPDNDGRQCTAGDLNVYYTPAGEGRARTKAYHDAFTSGGQSSMVVSPIIDGRTDAAGYLQGFNELSPELAAGYADTAAAQVCADPYADGIQFDLEPFDVTSRNGQYHFYLQVAKDFAGRHGGDVADPFGCVDAAHPRGRFFSVFTFAASIRPGTESATNVQDILNRYGNGYFMDSLYDLSSAPAGTLNGIEAYRRAADKEAADTKRWANRLHLKYGFGLPASASAHEFTTCTASASAPGSCVPDAAGATGYPMLDYAKAAVEAVVASRAQRDPRYLGTAIWDFGDHVSWDGLSFGPVPAPDEVLGYYAQHLPGPENPGLARGPRG